jgi:hypothetical protein
MQCSGKSLASPSQSEMLQLQIALPSFQRKSFSKTASISSRSLSRESMFFKLTLALITEGQVSPTFRKDDTPLNRKPGGLMEQSNASLQRGDQG